MNDDDVARRFELADLIHRVGRHLRPPDDLEPGPCTPVEIAVMRFINQHPGTSARVAAEATLLPSSNFSRAVGGLEAKGLVRREVDPRDARSVRLYPTAVAEANLRRLRDAWSLSLEGAVDDPATIDFINTALRHIEARLIARRRSSGEQQDASCEPSRHSI